MTVRLPGFVPEGLFLFCIVFGPLAFGAVEPWSRGILQVALILLGGATALRAPRRLHPIHWTILPAVLVLILLGLFQLANTRSLAAPAVFAPFTISSAATMRAVVLWASYAALLWSAPQILDMPGARRRFAWSLFLLGVFIAVLGVVQAANGNHFMYGLRPVRADRDIFGPYYNRNHAASLMSMSFLVGCGLFASRWGVRRGRTMVTAVSDMVATQAIFAVLLGIVAYGIIATRSRGSILGIIVSVAAVGGAMGFALSRKARWILHLGLLGATVCFGIFLLQFPWWIGFQEYHPTDAYKMVTREEIWRMGLRMVADFPSFGVGLGAFRFAFPAYQQPAMMGFVEHAHNDWLQLLIEGGAAGLVVVAAGLALLTRHAALAWMHAPSPEVRWMCAGVIAAAAAFGLHGLVDFSFQIPANAVVVLALLSFLGSKPAKI